MENLQLILVAAIVAEAVNESLQKLFVDKQFQWGYILSLVVGVGLAIATQINVLNLVGLSLVSGFEWVGVLFSGILFARGSNYIHDFVAKLTRKPVDVIYVDEHDQVEEVVQDYVD